MKSVNIANKTAVFWPLCPARKMFKRLQMLVLDGATLGWSETESMSLGGGLTDLQFHSLNGREVNPKILKPKWWHGVV